jgi:hypothetical protein
MMVVVFPDPATAFILMLPDELIIAFCSGVRVIITTDYFNFIVQN